MTEPWPFDPLVPMKYGAILADPPWDTRMRSARGYAKSPEAHYDTMTEAELCSLPVGHLAGPDCMLFLWARFCDLPRALRVMQAWGFTYKTGGPWVKQTSTGKLTFGTGYILRDCAELFLVGTIGEPAVGSRSVRNAILSLRREHSRKPPELRAMIETLRPRSHLCELFAREPWPGYEVWGDQTDRFAGDRVS